MDRHEYYERVGECCMITETNCWTHCGHRSPAPAICHVINCQFHEIAAAPLGPVNFLSPDQEYGIHSLIICGIQLLTPNNLDKT